MLNNLCKLILVFFVSWTLTLAQQDCTSDQDCQQYTHCEIMNNNTNSNTNSTCAPNPCIDCSLFNRMNSTHCSTCGECIEKYIDPGMSKLGFSECVFVDEPEYMNILLIFAIILPIAGLVVVGMSLLLGKFYHWRILRKVKSAQQLLDDDDLNMKL